jgi:hypothetical protein
LPWALRTRIDETAIIDSTGVFLDGISKKSEDEAPRVHHAARRRGGGMAGIDRNYLYGMMKKHGIARKE